MRKGQRSPRPGRMRRARQGGQAVIEMALVLPICLMLIAGYLAVMVLVQTEVGLQAAVELAAQSTLQAPVGDYTHGCLYADTSFFMTLDAGNGGNHTSSSTSCTVNDVWSGALNVTSFSCPAATDIYLNNPGAYASDISSGTAIPPVTCTVTARLYFSHTPLAWAIPYDPTFTVSSSAVPSNARQCQPGDTAAQCGV